MAGDADEADRVAVAKSWDTAYAAGRYLGDPPVDFVQVILRAVDAAGLRGAAGLYVGCGNGRNFLPLVDAGLDLTGLDVSTVALTQLAQRAPEHRHRLVHGDLDSLPDGATWPIVIGIQVFQHGDRDTAHATLVAAGDRVGDWGLLCVRVNALGTDIEFAHDVIETEPDGGMTVRYTRGPKRGLDVHFYTSDELRRLVSDRFSTVVPVAVHRTWRHPPQKGQWSQLEGIWQRQHHRT